MTTYTELLAGIRSAEDGSQTANVTENWMQGRTTYGGLTAALCLEAALPLSGGRPVRSAQIAFVGPVSGDIVSRATLLREGKNTAFVNVRMTGDAGAAAEAIFVFATRRTSQLDFSHLPMPVVDQPESIPSFFGDSPARPNFTNNFNMRIAGGDLPFSGGNPEFTLWMRHKDQNAKLDATTLLTLGDFPPPAAMPSLTAPARISSMTWMTEFLADDWTTENGWVLAHHAAEAARNGYSAQTMKMWATDGTPLMIGRQTIAVFDV